MLERFVRFASEWMQSSRHSSADKISSSTLADYTAPWSDLRHLINAWKCLLHRTHDFEVVSCEFANFISLFGSKFWRLHAQRLICSWSTSIDFVEVYHWIIIISWEGSRILDQVTKISTPGLTSSCCYRKPTTTENLSQLARMKPSVVLRVIPMDTSGKINLPSNLKSLRWAQVTGRTPKHIRSWRYHDRWTRSKDGGESSWLSLCKVCSPDFKPGLRVIMTWFKLSFRSTWKFHSSEINSEFLLKHHYMMFSSMLIPWPTIRWQKVLVEAVITTLQKHLISNTLAAGPYSMVLYRLPGSCGLVQKFREAQPWGTYIVWGLDERLRTEVNVLNNSRYTVESSKSVATCVLGFVISLSIIIVLLLRVESF